MCNTPLLRVHTGELERLNVFLPYLHFYFPIPFLKNVTPECFVSVSMHTTCVLASAEARGGHRIPRKESYRQL